MTRRRILAGRTALAIGVALALTACSSSGGDGDGSGSDDDKDLSPLEEYMGEGVLQSSMFFQVSSAAPEMTEEQKQEERKVQDAVAACMKDQGFDYVPYVPDFEAEGFDEANSLSPEEFAKKYGYGLATMGPMEDTSEDAENAESDDPNQKIYEELSADAKAAYDTALWGEGTSAEGGGVVVMDEGSDSDALTVSGLGGGGCFGTAQKDVTGVDPTDPDAFEDFEKFDSLWEDIDALRERVVGDARVRDAATAWAECMADAGYADYEKPEDAQSDVMDRMSALFGNDDSTGGDGPADGTPDDSATDSASGDDPPVEGPGRPFDPSTVDPEKLEELRTYEVDVATADYTCQQEHYVDVFDDVRAEVEQEFVDDHKADLEAYREWAGSQPGGGRMRVSVGVG